MVQPASACHGAAVSSSQSPHDRRDPQLTTMVHAISATTTGRNQRGPSAGPSVACNVRHAPLVGAVPDRVGTLRELVACRGPVPFVAALEPGAGPVSLDRAVPVARAIGRRNAMNRGRLDMGVDTHAFDPALRFAD